MTSLVNSFNLAAVLDFLLKKVFGAVATKGWEGFNNTKEKKNMKIKSMISFLIIVGTALVLVNCANQNKKTSLSRIHFDFDQSYIRKDMIPLMDGNVAYLHGTKKKSSTGSANYSSGKSAVTIEGHCDNRGTNEYNYALGHRRAESAKSYLVSHGINPSRIKTVSFGEDRAMCQQSNESCWYMNRRDEFVVK